MCALRDKRGREPPGGDGKADVKQGVEGMRRMLLRSNVETLAGERWKLPLWWYARRAGAPCERGRIGPRNAGRLSFGYHRLMHGSGPPGGGNEAGRLAVSESADASGVPDLRLHDARGEPKPIGESLRAKDCGVSRGRARHDGHKLAHPVERKDRDAMRGAKA